MSHDNEAVYRQVLAALNRGDIAGAVRFFAEDAVVVDYSDPDTVHSGRDAITSLLRSFFDLLPDLTIELVDVVARGDRLAAELVMRGTPADRSQPFEMQFGAIYRFRDGEVLYEHLYLDSRQLPVVPG